MTLMLLAVAWLLTYLVHSTILLGGAWTLSALRVVRSPAARDVLWKVALLGGILTATAQTLLAPSPAAGRVELGRVVASPNVEARINGPSADTRRTNLPTADASWADAPPADAGVAELTAAEPTTNVVGPPRASRRIATVHIGWPGMLLNVWLLGALGCLSALLVACLGLRHRLAGRREVVDGPAARQLAELLAATGVRSPVRLTVSDAIASPLSFGRAEICLPERALSQLTAAEQRAVLAHELGHVVRRDPAWQFAAALIGAVLFVQPLNRLARRRLAETAEYLCDDWAAERADGLVLARCLAEVATWLSPGAPALDVVPAMASRPSQLVARVQRLVEGGRPSGGRRGAGAPSAVALLGVVALASVAWTAPGFVARDLTAAAAAEELVIAGGVSDAAIERWAAGFAGGEETWLTVRDAGRLILLHPRYAARLSGSGRLAFRQWGRAIAVGEGYRVTVNGETVRGDVEACTDSQVRIVGPDGRVAWVLEPVRLDGRTRLRDRAIASASASAAASASGGADADDKLDAAIDTLVRAWARDPESVRAAATRLARVFERDLAPQFESLGVALGREMAPRLERVTDRLGRDLAPEFARLGAELGRTIATTIIDSDLAHLIEPGAGSGDFRAKPKRSPSR